MYQLPIFPKCVSSQLQNTGESLLTQKIPSTRRPKGKTALPHMLGLGHLVESRDSSEDQYDTQEQPPVPENIKQ